MMYSVIKMPASARARNATPDEFTKYIATPMVPNRTIPVLRLELRRAQPQTRPTSHDVKRKENQCDDEDQSNHPGLADIHIDLIGAIG
jgi:hypothetical protein